MKRRPYSQPRVEVAPTTTSEDLSLLDRLKISSRWLTTVQAASYLGKFRRKDGKPSQGAIRNMIYRKQIIAQKFFGRIMIDRLSLDSLIKLSPQTGGI